MKKFLSAVFVIAMLIITASITSSVLADPYVFTPEGENPDYPVVYYDEVGGTLTSEDAYTKSTDSTQAYKSMTDAVNALKSTGGYIILVSDYTFNNSAPANNVFGDAARGNFPSHSNMIILRGAVREDGTKAKVYLGGMPWAQGPLWLQNLELQSISTGDTYIAMHGYEFNFGTPGGDYTDVTVSKAPEGNNVSPKNPALLVGGDGGNYSRNAVWNLYSGAMTCELKLSGAYGATTINGDVTINNINCDMSSTSVTNGHVNLDKIMGNLYFNVSGGKWGGTPTLVNGTSSHVSGNIYVTISGNPDISGLKSFTIAGYNANNPSGLKGTSTLELITYTGSDKDAVISRLSSSFNAVLAKSAYVSVNGDDANNGYYATPVKSLTRAVELLEGQYGSIIVKDEVVIDNLVEATRSNVVILQGETSSSKVVFNGDYKLGGPLTVSNLTLVNGGEGAIIANGNQLIIQNNIITVPDANGTYLDIYGADRGVIDVVKLDIAAGIYNNIKAHGYTGSVVNIAPSVEVKGMGVIDNYVVTTDDFLITSEINGAQVEVSPFSTGSAAKFTPAASENIYASYIIMNGDGVWTSLRADNIPYVRVEYYLFAKDGDDFEGVYPKLVVDGEVLVSENPLVTNKWGVAFFDMSAIKKDISGFSFYPYGEAQGISEWNKIYLYQAEFSQIYNADAPRYADPDLTEDGDLIPYVYEPGDGLPVVYVSNGATYKGDYTGSVDSTKAYGTVNEAFTALKGVEAAYVILLDDVDFNRQIPTHSNMIILRGKENEDGSKVEIMFNYMANAGGPIAFENLNLRWIPRKDGGDDNDRSLSNGSEQNGYNYPIILGKEGVENDVQVYIYNINGGTIPTSTTITGTNVTINSGSYTIRFGAWADKITADSVNITLNGGTLNEINHTHNNTATATINGDVNVTINGGTLGNNFDGIGGSGKVTINGNVNFMINGGNFNSVPKNAIVAALSPSGFPAEVTGNRIIDILNYNGSTTNLREKVNTNGWNILNVNSIYVKDGGTGNGLTEATAMGNLADAVAACSQVIDGKVYGGRVVICGDLTIEGTVSEGLSHENNILYTSVNNGTIKFQEGSLVLDGPVTFKNIKFENVTASPSYIIANGHKVVFDSGIENIAGDGKYVSVVGGNMDSSVETVDVTIKSGEYQDVLAGNSVAGNVSIKVEGGTYLGNIVGGTSVESGVIGGNTTITIDGGTIKGTVIGGNDGNDGVINGSSNIYINGGEFANSSSIIASNSTASEIIGVAKITISGGNFSAMPNNSIKAGFGECTKVGIEYPNNSNAEDKVNTQSGSGNNFDAVMIPQDQGKSALDYLTDVDKHIHIIASYGDPANALKKSIPFSVNQTAKQSGAPVVVSPQQLNLKMEGSDHALMTLQTIKDTVDTIRFVPNHNPTKGSRIVVDGYNINGRGVDLEKYKYAEVVYYYTVPEGDTPVVENMHMAFVGKSAGIPAVTTGTLEPNKWATAIFDFTEAFADKTGTLAQYHLSPMGLNKKGTDIPVNQYLDIASMTFYTDKPNTVIKGGNAPNAKIVEKEEEKKPLTPAKPVAIEDIVVNVVNLKSTVDNSGAFTSAQVTKDGMTVMEYTPSLDSAKEMRIEGYNCMGKQISLNDYQYLTMKVFVETNRTDVQFKTQVTNCNGGVSDNPEKAKGVTWTAETPLVPNEWNTVTLKIAPADPAFHITRQFHIAPIGMIKGNTMQAGEKFYLAEFVLSNEPPKAPTAADEEEEIVEVEQEVIEEAPAVVIEADKLIRSSGNVATFNSVVAEFEGKKVAKIVPAKISSPVSIDGAAIFGKTEQTPDGALSLKKHRYAVISYYYATADAESERTPEFTLLGGRVQHLGNVVNGVVATGTAGLKKNEWATAIVKLSGNGEGEFTSGFNFRPFGNVAATNIASDDVLYIENITFVSNLPQ